MAIEWFYPLLSSSTSSGAAADPIDFSGNPNGGIQYVQLALNPATWDLEVPMRWLRGPDAVIQRLKIRCRFWRGEWFLDQRLGVPYRESVLIKNPDRVLVSAVFREVFETTPGVDRVPKLNAIIDRPTRHLLIDEAEIVLTDGALVVINREPFIVGG
jgi:hypothetical protein